MAPIKFVVCANNHHATSTQAFSLPSGGKPLIQYIHGLYYFEHYRAHFAFLGQVPAITQDVYTGLLMFIYFNIYLSMNFIMGAEPRVELGLLGYEPS